MIITELRKSIKQLRSTFKISKKSEVIVTMGDQNFRVKSVKAVIHNGLPHINIEIKEKGEE